MGLFGLSGIQLVILALTCAQNSSYSLLRRYSQGVLKENNIPSTILLVGEFMKFAVSLAIMSGDPKASGSPIGPLGERLSWLIRTSLPMAVPAGVYCAMNLLSFVSLQRIDAGLFTVIGQAKILTTALFGRFIMNRTLHVRKWRALTLVVMGAVLICNESKPVNFGPVTEDMGMVSFTVGLAAVLLEITLSGAVSVYFEKVLKNQETPHTVWDRNVQLAVLSGCAYLPIGLIEARGESLFKGFSWVTMMVATLGAAGGILVALAMKYTDSVIKCLAISGSIVATTLIGGVWLSAPMNLVVVTGSSVVIIAVFNYFDDNNSPKPEQPPPVQSEDDDPEEIEMAKSHA
mmetsp:Transcript_58130/g.142612  ORF Transcript_58130/g.142612 Transcript_58130/m.142612 type:complete len:346 (+) Transcript_58130:176-1213(+)